jgi:hypothetical protein
MPATVEIDQRMRLRGDLVRLHLAVKELRRVSGPRSPAAERFAGHVTTAFENLKHIIKRHENAVVWGR